MEPKPETSTQLPVREVRALLSRGVAGTAAQHPTGIDYEECPLLAAECRHVAGLYTAIAALFARERP